MAIHIKKSHRGLLHKDLGIKQGEKIPASKLAIKSTDSPALRKRKTFAKNAKSWKHQDGGSLPYTDKTGTHYNVPHMLLPQDSNIPSLIQPIQEEFNKTIPMNRDLSQAMQPSQKKQDNHQFNWVEAGIQGLGLADALIPGDRPRVPVVQPLEAYNQHPYGTGSQAIYEYGGKMTKGGKVSKTGYKRNSKDKNAPFLTIPSNNITMQGVDHPVMGVDNTGHSQMMQPGGNYQYPGNHVTEFPMKQMGGSLKAYNPNLAKKVESMENGGYMTYNPTEQINYNPPVSRENGGNLPYNPYMVEKWDGTKSKYTQPAGYGKRMPILYDQGGEMEPETIYEQGGSYNLSTDKIKELVSKGYKLKLI